MNGRSVDFDKDVMRLDLALGVLRQDWLNLPEDIRGTIILLKKFIAYFKQSDPTICMSKLEIDTLREKLLNISSSVKHHVYLFNLIDNALLILGQTLPANTMYSDHQIECALTHKIIPFNERRFVTSIGLNISFAGLRTLNNVDELSERTLLNHRDHLRLELCLHQYREERQPGIKSGMVGSVLGLVSAKFLLLCLEGSIGAEFIALVLIAGGSSCAGYKIARSMHAKSVDAKRSQASVPSAELKDISIASSTLQPKSITDVLNQQIGDCVEMKPLPRLGNEKAYLHQPKSKGWNPGFGFCCGSSAADDTPAPQPSSAVRSRYLQQR